MVWLDKPLSQAYLLLAKIYLDQGSKELAESTVQQAIEVHPRSYEAHFLRSRIHYKTGRPEQAKEQLGMAEGLRRAAR